MEHLAAQITRMAPQGQRRPDANLIGGNPGAVFRKKQGVFSLITTQYHQKNPYDPQFSNKKPAWKSHVHHPLFSLIIVPHNKDEENNSTAQIKTIELFSKEVFQIKAIWGIIDKRLTFQHKT